MVVFQFLIGGVQGVIFLLGNRLPFLEAGNGDRGRHHQGR